MVKRTSILLLVALIVGSFLIKLAHYDDPYWGGYIFRQLQTMSTIDGYVHEGIDLLKPRTNFAGWPGYIQLECPIFQAFAAWVSQMTGDPFATTGILNLIFAGLTIIVVYGIALFLFGSQTAVYSSLFFAFSPLNLMFHRSALIDVSAVFFAVSSYLVLLHLLEKRQGWLYALFFLSGVLALLIKPLYLLPVVVLFVFHFIKLSSPLSIPGSIKTLRTEGGTIFCFVLMAAVFLVWRGMIGSDHTEHTLMSHMGFASLIDIKFYLNLILRFFRQFLNPFNALFYLLGAIFILKEKKIGHQQILWLPAFYYVLFADINAPHSYYSLIMVPYFCMVAGYGAVKMEEAVIEKRFIKDIHAFRGLVYAISAFVSVLMFVFNIMTTMVAPFQRYEGFSREIAPQLDPVQYSIVYINRDLDTEVYEDLRDRPLVYIKSLFKDLGQEELKGQTPDHPLVSTAVLYSIKQYGRMIYIKPKDDIKLQERIDEFHNELRYVLFYAFKNNAELKSKMSPLKPSYESDQWLIYDLQEKP